MCFWGWGGGGEGGNSEREKVSLWCYNYKTHFVFPSVDLEKGNVVLPIDLVPRRVMDGALGLVSLQTFHTLQILEAELANVDHRLRGQFLGVRREVPGLDPEATQLDLLYVLHAGDGVFLVGVVTHASRGRSGLLDGGRGTTWTAEWVLGAMEVTRERERERERRKDGAVTSGICS